MIQMTAVGLVLSTPAKKEEGKVLRILLPILMTLVFIVALTAISPRHDIWQNLMSATVFCLMPWTCGGLLCLGLWLRNKLRKPTEHDLLWFEYIGLGTAIIGVTVVLVTFVLYEWWPPPWLLYLLPLGLVSVVCLAVAAWLRIILPEGEPND